MSDYDVNDVGKTSTNERADINIPHMFADIVSSIVKAYIFKFNRRQKNQFLLAAVVFLTFGIGDGFTGAYMMNVCGILSEANPFVRYIVETQGCTGLIFFKLWITFIILFTVLWNEKYSKESMYWMTNGFLVALGFGGVMATIANLMRVYDLTIFRYGVPPPFLIVLIYTGLMFVLVLFGNLIDNRTNSKYVHVTHV